MAQKKATNTITTTELEEKKVKQAASSDMVFVALNRPTGIRYAMKDGRTVEIGGNAAHLIGKDMGILPVKGGFGLTPIARSDWEEIKATYGETALFKSGRIFAQEKQADALAQTRELKDTTSGLEPTRGQATTEQEK